MHSSSTRACARAKEKEKIAQRWFCDRQIVDELWFFFHLIWIRRFFQSDFLLLFLTSSSARLFLKMTFSSCIIFSSVFGLTNQLFCWQECWKSKLSYRQQFQPVTTCVQRRALKYCYGRILVSYNWNNDQNFLSYSFGSEKHIIEKELERLMEIHQWTYGISCLFIFDWDRYKNVFISTSIVCRNEENCALTYVEYFYEFYRKQIDLIDDFNRFFVQERHVEQIRCYDDRIDQTIDCLPSEYPRCIQRSSKHLEQRACYSDRHRQIEYAFVISSNNHSLEKIHQLIICDTNDCNDQISIDEIEKMIYRYTLGKNFSIDLSSDGRNVGMDVYLIHLLEFSLVISKMIF